MESVLIPAYSYQEAYLIAPKRKRGTTAFDEYLLTLKHLPGQHDQRAHGRTTARRQAYRSAYRKVRDSGGSVQEARAAALDASRAELQKKLDERRAERDARRAEREANRKVQPKPPVVQPEETPTVPLVDTGGPYRTMDPKEVVASVKAFAEQVNQDLQSLQDERDVWDQEYNSVMKEKSAALVNQRNALDELIDSKVIYYRISDGAYYDTINNTPLLRMDISKGYRDFTALNDAPTYFTDSERAAFDTLITSTNIINDIDSRAVDARKRIDNVYARQLEAIKTADELVYDHIAVNMRHPNPYVPTFAYNDPEGKITPDQRARIEQGITRALGMIGADDAQYKDVPIQINYDGGGRASAGGSARFTVYNTDGNNSISTIWHESMHIIQSKTTLTAVDQIPHDFAIQRISASKEKKAKMMETQNKRKTKENPVARFGKYGNDEFGFYDKVDDPYTLKLYDKYDRTPFTEVLAMAFTDVRGQTTNSARYQDTELFEVGIRAIQNSNKKVIMNFRPKYTQRFTSVTDSPTFEQIKEAYQYVEVQP